MPVDNLHSEHLENSDTWETCRDVMSGERAIKDGGKRYVARLDSQSDEEFKAYVDRSFFYGATSRTVSGYLGNIFRLPPQFKIPQDSSPLGLAFSKFLNDCNLLGANFISYAKQVVNEVLVVGRGGTLIDWEDTKENRAYLAFYKAEDILNWKQERLGGRLQVTMIVLREFISVAKDEFTSEIVPQIRVLKLSDGVYSVDLYKQVFNKKKEAHWILTSSSIPTRRGASLPSIPFIFHGAVSSQCSVEKSPILDVVSANLDHYRMMTDYKHGMHFTALPTAWVAGFDKGEPLRIGSSSAWVTDTLGATAGFLEFKGDGLRTFERALDRVERVLVVLGSRLLETQKKVSESAEALSIRQAGESSIIAGLSLSISSSLTEVMKWVNWWHSNEVYPEDVSDVLIKLNTDFDTTELSASRISSLVAAWQAGAMSLPTLIHQFAEGELLPPGVTVEEEIATLKASPRPADALPVSGAVPPPDLVT